MSRGYFLKARQAAFIIDDTGEVELRLPKMDPNEDFPQPYMVILALAKLSMDPAWVEEIIEMAHEWVSAPEEEVMN